MKASGSSVLVCEDEGARSSPQKNRRLFKQLSEPLQAALRAFASVPLARRRGPVGGWAPWRGEPRALQGGAGASAGTSRRAAGGPVGGEAGGWGGGKSCFIFPIRDDKPLWRVSGFGGCVFPRSLHISLPPRGSFFFRVGRV